MDLIGSWEKHNCGVAGSIYWQIPLPKVRESKMTQKCSLIKNKMLLCQVNKLFWAFSDSCRGTTSILALLLELVSLCGDKERAEPQPRET